MHCLFHYMSVFIGLSVVVLLSAGIGLFPDILSRPLVGFVAVSYAGFGLTQLFIAWRSDLHRGPLRLFQWMFFAAIAVLALLGIA